MAFDRQLGFFSQDRTRIASREALPHPPATDHAWVQQPGRTVTCRQCKIQARDDNEVTVTCLEMRRIAERLADRAEAHVGRHSGPQRKRKAKAS